jgi:hypothetical protein
VISKRVFLQRLLDAAVGMLSHVQRPDHGTPQGSVVTEVEEIKVAVVAAVVMALVGERVAQIDVLTIENCLNARDKGILFPGGAQFLVGWRKVAPSNLDEVKLEEGREYHCCVKCTKWQEHTTDQHLGTPAVATNTVVPRLAMTATGGLKFDPTGSSMCTYPVAWSMTIHHQ